MALILGRLYILFSVIVATLISSLMIYQAFHSKLLDSIVLKIGISSLTIIGLYSLILPTQTPSKFGVKPDVSTKNYLDKIIGKKLNYIIAPNNKIGVYEIPHLIIFRKTIIYIGIGLFKEDKNVFTKFILDKLNQSSVNPLKKELAFWQGIASVTSNNFQFWKAFTNWYINYLSKLVAKNEHCDKSNKNDDFNSYVINSIKQNKTNILETYIRKSNQEFAVNDAINLDNLCRNSYLAGYAILNEKELTYETGLTKYEDTFNLLNWDIPEILQSIIEKGLNERLNFDIKNTVTANFSDTQYAQILEQLTKISPHIDILKIDIVRLKYLPQIPTYIVFCIQKKTYFDINERSRLIEIQLQSKLNELSGDWKILVFNNKAELLSAIA